MGMFNYVNYKDTCPNCGAEVTDWQTKDGGDLFMAHVNPSEVDYFYGPCPKCDSWLDATVQKTCIVTGITVQALPKSEKFSMKPRREDVAPEGEDALLSDGD